MIPFIRKDKLKQHLIELSTLFIISIVIWFIGPTLKISNQFSLSSIEKRCYFITILFLLWILYLFVKPEKNATINQPKTSEAKTKLKTLQGRFFGAIRFLKKTVVSKHDKEMSLLNLPWYLLIGPSGAGKTTLLANANINYILTKQFKQDKVVSSDMCDWWVTRDLVLVDVPGIYLKEKNNYLWDAFLNLIKKNTQKNIAQAMVIALPLPELIKQSDPQIKKQLIIDIKQKILQIREQFGPKLSIYIIITKCDQLPGFSEFFCESSTEDLAQAWGFTLPSLKNNDNLLDIFTLRFNSLIKRLNDQLIWRLHQERNANARPSIKDFPLQIERLKESIRQVLQELSITDLPLHGIYLTSATQNATDESAQSQVINPAHQTLNLLRAPAMPQKAHFIRQVILQGLLSHAQQPILKFKPKNRWKRRIAYTTSIFTIIISAALLGHDFLHSVLQTYAIQNNLAQYQLAIQQSDQQGDQLLKALPLLNSLQSAANRTNNKNLFRFSNLLSFYSDKSQQTANKLYQQALQTIVFPSIKNYLENYLKNPNGKNPAQVYAVLKAYLMLGDTQKIQAQYLSSILKQLIPFSFNKKTDEDLINHIQVAASKTNASIKLNSALIESVREKLTSLTNEELAFVILKNTNNNNMDYTIDLDIPSAGQPVFVSKPLSNRILNLYTANKFTTVYNDEIPAAAKEALQGNWVIGNAQILTNEATIHDLEEAVRSQYVGIYVNTWEGLFNNLTLISPSSLTQVDAMISELTGNASPLLQMLKIIKQNTSFEPVTNASEKLSSLNTLISKAQSNKENTLYQLFVTLRQLHFYLQNMLGTNDIGYSAFAAAKSRMLNSTNDPLSQVYTLAAQSPEPLKTWLNTLATQSWHFILQETGNYVENAWQVNIVNIYRSQFEHRFPLDDSAENEIDLQEFVNFTGKQGIFANFYQRYLKPFVNDYDKHWQWRAVDNQKLPFSNATLEQIQQASKLQAISKYAVFSQGHKNSALQQFKLPGTLIES